MKKIIFVFMTVWFLIGFFSVSAAAAGEKIVVKAEPSSNILGRGDTFTVDFNLTSNAGITTLGIEVTYDSNELEIVCPNHTDGKSCINGRSPVSNKFKPSNFNNSASDSQFHTAKPYKIMWAFSNATENITYTGCIATLTFRVKPTASLTNTIISVKVDQASRVKEERYSKNELSSHNTTISIACKKHTFSDWKQETAPTCTENGTEIRTCSNCKKEEIRSIASTEHKLGDWEIETAPTCTETGVGIRKCTNKDCKYNETKKVSATGHKMGEWSTVKEPTCEQNGEQKRNCILCSYKEIREIKSLNHKFGNPTVIKAPTCTETGTEYGKCSICNKETTNIIPALGHKIENSVIETAPTCTNEGKKQGVCSVCGEKNAEQIIPALGHSFGEPVVIKEATSTKTGTKISTCTVCGEKKEEIIPIVADLEISSQDDFDKITVNAEKSEKYLIILLVAVIIIGIATAVISVIKIKSIK